MVGLYAQAGSTGVSQWKNGGNGGQVAFARSESLVRVLVTSVLITLFLITSSGQGIRDYQLLRKCLEDHLHHRPC